MDDIYPIFEVIEREGEMVLATIINVKGSAYKKEGSSMIFLDDGSQIGMLSAGCLETDLAERAKWVSKEQRAAIFEYDLSEVTDLGWGQGTGCNGTIEVLLEPVTDEVKSDLLRVKKILASPTPVTMLKRVDELGEYLYLTEKGEAFGNWHGEKPAVSFSAKSGMIQAMSIFQHTYQPKPRLIVFGAGPDAIPLVSIAAKTGFFTVVCDWRKGCCASENFPEADELIVGFPDELLDQFSFTPYDFVVIMSHHFQRDQEFLMGLLHEKVKYLGVLGPRERTKRLLMGEQLPDWIYTPLGFDIQAVGSSEIAVSIIAQMIEVWRKPRYGRTETLWAIPD